MITKEIKSVARRQTMTEPTNTDKARYVAERLGLCWHEELDNDGYCLCGRYHSQMIGVHMNPTFLDPAGRIQLLELMEKYPLFFAQLIYGTGKNVEAIDDDGYIPREYLKEESLLLDAAYRFLREKEKKNPMCLCPDDKALCTIHPAT
jgi:hypothetical protein